MVEAAAAVIGAADVEEREEAVVVVRVARRRKSRRRKTYSTWRSTWTRRSVSSLMGGGKVRFFQSSLSLLCLFLLPGTSLWVERVVDWCFALAVTGTLKGYDQLMNLVLDDVKELMRGMSAMVHDASLASPPAPSPSILCPLYLCPIGFSRLYEISTHDYADDEGNESSRPLGLIVARGTLLVLISPLDGSQQIENPFTVSED